MGNPLSGLEADASLTTWIYDAANQLGLDNRSGTSAAYRKNWYDSRGNRTEQDLASTPPPNNTFTYDAANQVQQLQFFNPAETITTYTYDAAGNLIGTYSPTSQLTTYVWDDEGRNKLVQLSSGVSVTSTFNGDNLRMQRVDNTGTVQFIWDGLSYLAETNASNVIQAEYTQEPTTYGGLLSQYRLTVPSYYHFDRIGSTRALTNSSGTITDTYNYEAFGTSLGGTGSTTNPFTWIGRFGYYQDTASGLVYVRRRFYSPVIAKWVSNDPVGFFAGDVTLSRYVVNRVLMFIDPTGLIDAVIAKAEVALPKPNTGTASQLMKKIAVILVPRIEPALPPGTPQPDDEFNAPNEEVAVNQRADEVAANLSSTVVLRVAGVRDANRQLTQLMESTKNKCASISKLQIVSHSGWGGHMRMGLQPAKADVDSGRRELLDQ